MADETLTPRQLIRDAISNDRMSGHSRQLSQYLALFPGRDAEVAAEYLALSSPGTSIPSSGRTPNDPEVTEIGVSSTTPSIFSSSSAVSSESIGPYRILRELGRGGQGVVYLAEDSRLSRRVALKVLTSFGHLPEEVLARFRREAAVASKLDHPGICAVYDTGTHSGVPYIAMRYVEGKTFRDLIFTELSALELSDIVVTFGDSVPPRETKTSTSERGSTSESERRRLTELISITEKAARALHAAHEAGIVHRDIKPQNIIITPEGEPVLLDFGLARDIDSDQPALTRSGEVFGTPSYMAPEQIEAQGAIDRRADVYALGVTLYEAVTKKRPFEAATREQLYQAILSQTPVDPRKLNRQVSNDLCVVIETAIEKDRDHRYQSALALAEDLRRVRVLEPILARPAGLLLRLRRWTQRNPVLASSVLGSVVLFIVAAALLSYGLGASEKVKFQERAHELERMDLIRTRAEAEGLQQREKDRALRQRLSDLTIVLGAQQGLAKGKMDVCPITKDYIGVFRDYGLVLDSEADPKTWLNSYEAQVKRDPEQSRVLLNGLYDIALLLEAAGVSRAAEKKRGIIPAWAKDRDKEEWDLYLEIEPWLVEVWERLHVFIDQVEQVPWRKDVWAASRTWFATQKDTFEPFLRKEFLDGKAAVDLAWFARCLMFARWQSLEPVRILELALADRPDIFELQFAVGGLSLSHARSRLEAHGPSFEAQALLDKSIHHLRVSIALRPDAALVCGLVGSAYDLAGNPELGGHWIERGVTLGKDQPLAWFMKGRHYARLQTQDAREKALAALNEAIALDPKLDLAYELKSTLE